MKQSTRLARYETAVMAVLSRAVVHDGTGQLRLQPDQQQKFPVQHKQGKRCKRHVDNKQLDILDTITYCNTMDDRQLDILDTITYCNTMDDRQLDILDTITYCNTIGTLFSMVSVGLFPLHITSLNTAKQLLIDQSGFFFSSRLNC